MDKFLLECQQKNDKFTQAVQKAADYNQNVIQYNHDVCSQGYFQLVKSFKSYKDFLPANF